jgi:hypothetical protein
MRYIVVLGALAAIGSHICAQSSSLPQALGDQFRKESVVIERTETTIRMHGDGTGERILHALIHIQSEGAVQLIRPTQAVFQANRSEDDQANASSSANDVGAKAVQLKSGTRVLSGESGDASPEDTPPQN